MVTPQQYPEEVEDSATDTASIWYARETINAFSCVSQRAFGPRTSGPSNEKASFVPLSPLAKEISTDSSALQDVEMVDEGSEIGGRRDQDQDMDMGDGSQSELFVNKVRSPGQIGSDVGDEDESDEADELALHLTQVSDDEVMEAQRITDDCKAMANRDDESHSTAGGGGLDDDSDIVGSDKGSSESEFDLKEREHSRPGQPKVGSVGGASAPTKPLVGFQTIDKSPIVNDSLQQNDRVEDCDVARSGSADMVGSDYGSSEDGITQAEGFLLAVETKGTPEENEGTEGSQGGNGVGKGIEEEKDSDGAGMRIGVETVTDSIGGGYQSQPNDVMESMKTRPCDSAPLCDTLVASSLPLDTMSSVPEDSAGEEWQKEDEENRHALDEDVDIGIARSPSLDIIGSDHEDSPEGEDEVTRDAAVTARPHSLDTVNSDREDGEEQEGEDEKEKEGRDLDEEDQVAARSSLDTMGSDDMQEVLAASSCSLRMMDSDREDSEKDGRREEGSHAVPRSKPLEIVGSTSKVSEGSKDKDIAKSPSLGMVGSDDEDSVDVDKAMREGTPSLDMVGSDREDWEDKDENMHEETPSPEMVASDREYSEDRDEDMRAKSPSLDIMGSDREDLEDEDVDMHKSPPSLNMVGSDREDSEDEDEEMRGDEEERENGQEQVGWDGQVVTRSQSLDMAGSDGGDSEEGEEENTTSSTPSLDAVGSDHGGSEGEDNYNALADRPRLLDVVLYRGDEAGEENVNVVGLDDGSSGEGEEEDVPSSNSALDAVGSDHEGSEGKDNHGALAAKPRSLDVAVLGRGDEESGDENVQEQDSQFVARSLSFNMNSIP
ncbi:hypothetical protein H1R20_g221, partial [Candolleomyces eurysporus]